MSSYECAFKEGLVNYGGTVGASAVDRYDIFGTRTFGYLESYGGSGRPKPKHELYVAALFHDLIDVEIGSPDHITPTEPKDRTSYSTRYVMMVFATCEVKHPHRIWRDWQKRNDVSDFVWCLENRVDTSLHRTYLINKAA